MKLKASRDLSMLPRDLWILRLANPVNRMGTMALPFSRALPHQIVLGRSNR